MSSLIDSKHQKLSQDEIIAIAAKETGGKHTPEQIKASLMQETYQMKGLLIREGNTLFIVHPTPVQAKKAALTSVKELKELEMDIKGIIEKLPPRKVIDEFLQKRCDELSKEKMK